MVENLPRGNVELSLPASDNRSPSRCNRLRPYPSQPVLWNFAQEDLVTILKQRGSGEIKRNKSYLSGKSTGISAPAEAGRSEDKLTAGSTPSTSISCSLSSLQEQYLLSSACVTVLCSALVICSWSPCSCNLAGLEATFV